MGRRRDRPADQAAKGYPGRRKSKVEKAIEEAERLAKLLAAAAPESGAPFAPPAFLDKRFAPALAIWREYVPQLARLNLFQALDRHTFALFCVYYGEWVTANEDILASGYSKQVKTVSGDKMWRENPSVSRRDVALKAILELSKRFGLTQLDRYALLGHQASHPLGGLFEGSGEQKTSGEKPGTAGESAKDGGPIGIMDGLDSAPPGSRPN